MKTRIFDTIGLCLREALCQPKHVRAVCVSSLANIRYVSLHDLTEALIGAHHVKGAAVAFHGHDGRHAGTRCMVLHQLNNGDYLYQEKTLDAAGEQEMPPAFTMLFDDEQRARMHFHRASMRHQAEQDELVAWQEVALPTMSIFDLNPQEFTRVLH